MPKPKHPKTPKSETAGRRPRFPRKGAGRRGLGPSPDHVDDATIAAVAEGIAADPKCDVCGGPHATADHVDAGDDRSAVVGRAFEVAAQLRSAVGKHGGRYKARLLAALRDEKDPLYEVLRKAGKRVLAKTIMGD